MKVYEKLYHDILNEVILVPETVPGSSLPTRERLIERFGGSPHPMRRAILNLEKQGYIHRISPYKFIVKQKHRSSISPPKVTDVGLINFDGHVFGDFAHMLIPRLYDRKLVPKIMPAGSCVAETERCAAYFLQNKFKALLLHNFQDFRPSLLKQTQIETVIQLFSPYYIIPNIESHNIFNDKSFCMYDTLRRLRNAGYKRVRLLLAGMDIPGEARFLRSNARMGYERFMSENKDLGEFRVDLDKEDYSVLKKDLKKIKAWARHFDPDTQAVVCSNDFAVVQVREWLQKYTDIDYRGIQFVGYGNTDWANIGPEPFPSYDLRIREMLDLVVAIIDSPPAKSGTKWLKPKAVQFELISNKARENEEKGI